MAVDRFAVQMEGHRLAGGREARVKVIRCVGGYGIVGLHRNESEIVRMTRRNEQRFAAVANPVGIRGGSIRPAADPVVWFPSLVRLDQQILVAQGVVEQQNWG